MLRVFYLKQSIALVRHGRRMNDNDKSLPAAVDENDLIDGAREKDLLWLHLGPALSIQRRPFSVAVRDSVAQQQQSITRESAADIVAHGRSLPLQRRGLGGFSTDIEADHYECSLPLIFPAS
jgi:hypothetical protein